MGFRRVEVSCLASWLSPSLMTIVPAAWLGYSRHGMAFASGSYQGSPLSSAKTSSKDFWEVLRNNISREPQPRHWELFKYARDNPLRSQEGGRGGTRQRLGLAPHLDNLHSLPRHPPLPLDRDPGLVTTLSADKCDMANMLHDWLHQEVYLKLLMGHSWLWDKFKSRGPGLALDAWVGIYEDNGSSFDMIMDEPGPDKRCFVQIIQNSPFTISDGRHYIEAIVSKECLRVFRKQNNAKDLERECLHDIVTVRKFRLRFTSHGRPRAKLQIVLEEVAWQGGSGTGTFGHPKPIIDDKYIKVELEKLQQVQDKCDKHAGGFTKIHGASAKGPTPNNKDDPGAGSTMLHSQIPFATQVEQPNKHEKPLLHEGNNQDLSSARLISLVNVREDQEKPATAATGTSTGGQALLMLLSKSKDRSRLNRDTVGTTNRLSAQNVVEDQIFETADASQPRPRGERDIERYSLPDRHTQLHTSPQNVTDEQLINIGNVPRAFPIEGNLGIQSSIPIGHISTPSHKHDIYYTEAEWMKDYIFNHDSAVVDRDQRKLLARKDTWQKPEPPHRFPAGNIPIKTLVELGGTVAEDVNIEPDLDSGEDDNKDAQPDLDQEIHSEPSSTPESVYEEPASSLHSWSALPSPQPPKIPAQEVNMWPPDSSLPTVKDAVQNAKSTPILHAQYLGQDNACHREDTEAITNNVQSHGHDEENPQLSSLPSGSFRDDSDGDMEFAVPQALGRDAVVENKSSLNQTRADITSVDASTQPSVVVQVKETPYIKGKNAQSILNFNGLSVERQPSSGSSEETNATSIVYSACNDPNSSASLIDLRKEDVTRYPIDQELRVEETIVGGNVDSMTTLEPTAVHLDPIASILQPKRGPEESPRKIDPRQSKRREIKIVDFGSNSPTIRSPSHIYLQQKKTFIKEDREKRRLAPAVASPSAPIHKQAHFSTPFDAGPESADKDIIKRPNRSESVRQSIEPLNQLSRSRTSMSVQSDDGTASVLKSFKSEYPEYTGDRKHFLDLCRQILQLRLDNNLIPNEQWDDYIVRNRVDYKAYAVRRIASGDDVLPYLEYYRSRVKKVSYGKGVVADVATVRKAIRELEK
ncbi:hypothetical protein CC78DRAFT_589816 [Lojkania enalia]|uniref:Shelterin complex subunit TPP1/Est3 domain-containing protein n=1 Tax=Lojkania enalia TaxID=147567 RepID=A0A9P4K366_9PLEO|nr:hypothetical protein CC78DRAFT_589816 [Didymosphaeria enalia]